MGDIFQDQNRYNDFLQSQIQNSINESNMGEQIQSIKSQYQVGNAESNELGLELSFTTLPSIVPTIKNAYEGATKLYKTGLAIKEQFGKVTNAIKSIPEDIAKLYPNKVAELKQYLNDNTAESLAKAKSVYNDLHETVIKASKSGKSIGTETANKLVNIKENAVSEGKNLASETEAKATNLINEGKTNVEALGNQARTSVEALGNEARTSAEALGNQARTSLEELGNQARTSVEALGNQARNSAPIIQEPVIEEDVSDFINPTFTLSNPIEAVTSRVANPVRNSFNSLFSPVVESEAKTALQSATRRTRRVAFSMADAVEKKGAFAEQKVKTGFGNLESYAKANIEGAVKVPVLPTNEAQNVIGKTKVGILKAQKNAENLVAEQGTNANRLVGEAQTQANALGNEASNVLNRNVENVSAVANELGHNATSVVNRSVESASNLANETATQAKNALTEAGSKATNIATETATQAKTALTEGATQAKELVGNTVGSLQKSVGEASDIVGGLSEKAVGAFSKASIGDLAEISGVSAIPVVGEVLGLAGLVGGAVEGIKDLFTHTSAPPTIIPVQASMVHQAGL
jgi:hypothetical protein